jgi:hypothetical protein
LAVVYALEVIKPVAVLAPVIINKVVVCLAIICADAV